MKCRACEARISKRAKFCSRCGQENAASALPPEPEGELKAYAKYLVAEGGVAVGELKDAAVKGLKSDAGKSILVWGAFGAAAKAIEATMRSSAARILEHGAPTIENSQM